MVSVHMIVTQRNRSPSLHWNLSSLLVQSYPKLRITYIDDASTDGSREVIEDVLGHVPGRAPRITPVCNTVRRGVIANIVRAIATGDEDVILPLDGDDALARPDAVECVAAAYEDPDVWLTYGSFLAWPSFSTVYEGAYPEECVRDNLFRRRFWSCAPPRSFRRKLFDLVPDEYLRDTDGSYWELANDQGLILPMLELAGRRIRHIPYILYLYNLWNWERASSEKLAELAGYVKRIRDRPALAAIDRL